MPGGDGDGYTRYSTARFADGLIPARTGTSILRAEMMAGAGSQSCFHPCNGRKLFVRHPPTCICICILGKLGNWGLVVAETFASIRDISAARSSPQLASDIVDGGFDLRRNSTTVGFAFQSFRRRAHQPVLARLYRCLACHRCHAKRNLTEDVTARSLGHQSTPHSPSHII